MFAEMLEIVALTFVVPFIVDFMPGYDWADLDIIYEN